MKRGPKRLTPAEKEARGTARPHRDGDLIEVVEPNALPQQPAWLTAEGEEIWQDDLGRVIASRIVTERDSTAFGNYCNLQGMIVRCWRKGEAPPITALVEARRLQEVFGIAGARSRIQSKGGGAPGGSGNPFLRNGARR
jgi:hypothetical protein